ncbi:ATP-binding protein [Halomicroarcula sp. GCM10025709]|uniref:sensor histidine kinase n=1 Tax=Halomicroarcula sp. GCM10025709 TaxID=3252669 RepID=UPI003622FC97
MQPKQDWTIHPDQLRHQRPALSVEVAETLSEALARRDESIDCLVAGFEISGGTAVELLDQSTTDRPDPPVVLAVAASDGTVPVEAVSEPFADVVPVTDSDESAAELAGAVAAVIPETNDPEIAGVPFPDARSMNDWKATLFDQFFTGIPQHMFVKDECGRHVVVSESAISHRIHRRSDEYLGRRDIDGVVPDAEAREPYEDDISVIETGEPIHNKEEYYAESGRWFLTSKDRWEDETRGTRGLLGVAQEITDRKERERQLRIVTHLVRHNLRNQLNVISGRAEYLIDNPGAAPEAGQCILDAALGLIEQLDKQQTILKIMVGEPEVRPVDLGEVVRSEVEALSRQYPAASIEADIEDGVVGSATDNVNHAITELLENAISHSSRSTPHVDVSVRIVDGEARIRVVDECPAIPEFEVEVLTGQRTVDQLSHSTGLGLWITQWVVTHADGAVSFDRATDGNAVTVTIPTAEWGG